MIKHAATLALLVALSGLWHQPAAASKLVALVVGNETQDDGLGHADLTSKLAELKNSLFNYGDETYIIDGVNLSKKEFSERIGRFEAKLKEAEIAVFYFSGIGAHNLAGNSYLVPRGWDGRQEDELIALGGLLERMRLNPNIKGLVFLDALKPASASTWQPTVRPGLGTLGREAEDDRLQIASLEMLPEPASSAGYLTRALVRQLQPERIKLPQFASLVQQDVSFDTGSIYVPRLFGSLGGSLELQRLSREELAAKQQRCIASREKDALDAPMRVAARPDEMSRNVFWHWFCPEPPRPASARPAPEQPRHRLKSDNKETPTRRSTPREYRGRERSAARAESGSQRSYGSGGGASGSRAAASAVPTP